MKKICSLLLIVISCFVLIGMNNINVNAASTVKMTKSDGTTLTYRNVSTPVYQLAEYNYPTSQLRAVWVSAFVGDVSGYSTEAKFKTEHTTLLNNLETMGMNAMVYHIRTHNNALYDSDLNPIASIWSSVNFTTFDPLEWLIEECHKRGIEFHAWMNPYRVSNTSDKNYLKGEAIPSTNPASNDSNLIYTSNGIILDPGIPENREFLVDTCMEVVEKYNVDAIHFDDYFYSDGADDSTTRAKYNTTGLSIGNFRRLQIDTFIETLSSELRAYNTQNKRTVQLGIAPPSVYRNGGFVSSPTYDSNGNLTGPLYSNTAGFAHYDDYLYADTLKWINNEWIDYIMPQMYHGVEHSTSSFVELTKWWSWAVKNKKVNFYAGIGIYMAEDYEGAWTSDNELERQLLNAGQYTEFAGACLYKYSTLRDASNSIIQTAVDLISNDYWAKRVPGAVQKYYAPLMDTVCPSEAGYSSSTKSIIFDEVDGARGYMVYQVPKGETLNQNSIDHIYGYYGTNSVVISDITNYDYYVAGVNLANEVSSAIKVSFLATSENVIALINALPTTITFDDIDAVYEARDLYLALSSADQALVTNMLKLQQALKQAKTLESIEATLDTFIASVDTHLKTDRILPTASNITWSYKNTSDSSIYSIETGERLKEYLNKKYITLIATITENTSSVSKEVVFNVGYVAESQTGLFYRNDASSMGPNDSGSYTEGSSSYIGWSGHTLTLDNKIWFIAAGNYFEITNASNIGVCQASSAGSLYANKTGDTLTLTLSSLYSTTGTSTDSYFILNANNEIIGALSGYSTSTKVTLENNQKLVILKYLDTKITGTNLYPVTSLTIGTQVVLDPVIENVGNTPVIDLTENKLNAKQEITTYINTVTSNYETTLASKLIVELNKVISSYVSNIENADIEETINTEVLNAKNAIDTYINNLNNAKTNAKQEITSYISTISSTYATSVKNKLVTELNKVVASYITNIENAEKTDSLNQEVLKAKNAIDTYISNLNSTISNAQEELNAKVNLGKNTSQKTYIQNIIAKVDLTICVTISEVINLKEQTINNINTYITNITTTINNAINTINSYNDNTNEVISLINEYTTYINNCSLESEVTNLVNQFVTAYTNMKNGNSNVNYQELRENAKTQIQAYVVSLNYNTSEINCIEEIKVSYFINIDASSDVNYLNNVVTEFKQEVTLHHETLTIFVNNALTNINAKEPVTDEAQALVDATRIKVVNAGSSDEVQSIMDDFNEAYDSANTVKSESGKSSKCSMGTSVIFVNLTLILTAALALFRKRK